MYSSEYFNSKYMQFVGCDIHDKFILTSGEGCRNTNKIRKQGITKININMTYPSSTLSFVCCPHKDTCDILSEYLFSHILQAYSSKNQGGIFWYINKVK